MKTEEIKKGNVPEPEPESKLKPKPRKETASERTKRRTKEFLSDPKVFK